MKRWHLVRNESHAQRNYTVLICRTVKNINASKMGESERRVEELGRAFFENSTSERVSTHNPSVMPAPSSDSYRHRIKLLPVTSFDLFLTAQFVKEARPSRST